MYELYWYMKFMAIYVAETCSLWSPIDKVVFSLDLHSLYSLIFLLTCLFGTCCLLSHG